MKATPIFGLTAGRIRHILLVLAVSTVFTLVAYDIAYIVRAPFWWDELWVAISARFPLSDLPAITSSTPIGFNALQRLLAPLGDQAQRILPLLFTVLCSTASYFLGYVASRGTRIVRVLSGVFVGAVVAMNPLMLQRTDLKQYSADVFTTILIIVLAVMADRGGSRRALYALTAVSSLGMLFTLSIPFTAAAAFGTLLIAAAFNRRWKQIKWIVIGGAISGASIVIAYLALYSRSNSALKGYWAGRGFFPTIDHVPSFVIVTTGLIIQSTSTFRIVAVIATIVLILVAGFLIARRTRRFVPPLFVVVLFVEMTLLGVLRIYPLLDLRTSLFMVVAIVAVSGLILAQGAVELAALITRKSSRRLALTAALAAGLIGTLVLGGPSLRSHSITVDYFLSTPEDARSQIDYIRTHQAPGDLIVTDARGAMALGYYWPSLGGHWQPSDTLPNGFGVGFPTSSPVTVADLTVQSSELRSTIGQLQAAHPGATIWFITTHHRAQPFVGLVNVPETFAVQRVDVGPEPLYRLTPATTP